MIAHKVGSEAEGQVLAASLFTEASNNKPKSPVGLATGGTMDGVYKQLALSGFKPSFQHAFALDEYAGISPDSKNSYLNELTRKFSKPLGFGGELHVPGQGKYRGEDGNDLFEKDIAELGPLSVQLLGIGVNGHIAFNEPGSDFESRTRKIELHQETIEANSVYFQNPEDVPRYANTQGLATIGEADLLLLLVFGDRKRQALLTSIHTASPEKPLAALLDHRNLVLITDLEI